MYGAYHLLVTIPVKKEMKEHQEKVDSDKRIADAYKDDYDKIHTL